MKLNQVQKTYITAKAAYDAAFKNEDWDLVDKLEDPYIESEFALVTWTFDECIKTGKFSKKDADFMIKNSNTDQWNKFVDMGMRLAV